MPPFSSNCDIRQQAGAEFTFSKVKIKGGVEKVVETINEAGDTRLKETTEVIGHMSV